jgi:serine/threonine-protein kinase
MDRSQREQIEELFAAARELPVALRAAWLESAASDPEVRREVAALLVADAVPESVLDQPLPAIAALAASEEEEERAAGTLAGRQLGAYRLEELIGQGGSAAVYRATREAAGARQTVAVKVLRRGLHAEVEHRLFQREQRLLVRLDHPDIARWIDGGVTPEGIPFLVVEHVEGEPLTVACERRGLPRRERLALFVRLCRAVEAAHAALVVHRDLKPQNILIGALGQLKVLDFGVAKLLDEAETEAEASLTASGRLTPGYAAPEQLAGGAITVATDVFALGVLLAELCLGRRPARSALEVAALRSAGLAPAELAHIVAQACAVEPSRRYGGVAELREDVERLLSGQPVQAHPPSLRYRARKFLARHRAAVGTAAVIALALVTATAIANGQARVARGEAARAERAAATSRAVQEFMVGLFASAAAQVPSDRAPTTRELLDLGVERARRDFAGQPEVAIDLLRRFTESYIALREPDRAEIVAAEYFAAARARYGEDSAEAAQARLERGRVAYLKNDFQRAERDFRAAQAVLERLAPLSSELADTEAQLGALLISTDRTAEGIALSERAQRVFDRACAAQAATVDCVQAIETGYGIAIAESIDGRFEAARERLLPLVERGRTQLSDRRLLAQMINSLGAFHQRSGALGEAERYSREALEMALAVGDSAADVVSQSRSELASAHAARGELRAAADELGALAAAMDRSHPTGHRLAADHRVNRAIYLIDLGDLRPAKQALDWALAWYRREAPPHVSGEARALELMARLLGQQGRFEEARNLALRAVKLRRAAPVARDVGSALMTLARAHLDRREAREALAAAREGYAASVEGLGEKHPLQAARSARLGDALLAAGERAAAREAIERAARWGEERLAASHPSRCRVALSRARFLLAEGEPATARQVARDACATFTATFGRDSEILRDLRALERALPKQAAAAAARQRARQER